jgi:CheY-like chemotaxis protein
MQFATPGDHIQILLADDDADDRNFFQDAVSGAAIDAQLSMVEDGQQLMDYIAEIKEPPPPHIIFIDINMPLKNGKHCLEEIRSNEHFNAVPIVIISTSTYINDINETYDIGANLFLQKSFFFDNDISTLNELFATGWEKNLLQTTRKNFLFSLNT